MSLKDSLITITVSEADDDIRLDRWFKRHYPGYPHAMLEKTLRKGLIRVDGKKAEGNTRIAQGQQLSHPPITIEAKPKKRYNASEEEYEALRRLVIYKDANIVVINKPYGLPVQGGTKVAKSLDDLLDGLRYDSEERPKLVHRLDRDTSGVLVLARNAKVATKLSRAFAGKDIQKTYWALVTGCPLEWKGLIDYKLMKSVQGDSSFERVAVDDEDGKYAQTEYRVIEGLARKFAFMELKPLTGRTHQLRVHMKALGHPIVGDPKYGDYEDYGPNDAYKLGVEDSLHLHARRIQIPAHVLGKAVDVSATLPKHMKHSFDMLGINAPKK